MKSNLSKFFGASVLAVSLSVLPSALPAAAQTDAAPGGTTTTAPTATAENDRDFDWGWLGLLGLLGLAGLTKKPEARYSDPEVANRTTSTRY